MSKRDKILSALGLNVRKNREAREFTQEKLAAYGALINGCHVALLTAMSQI